MNVEFDSWWKDNSPKWSPTRGRIRRWNHGSKVQIKALLISPSKKIFKNMNWGLESSFILHFFFFFCKNRLLNGEQETKKGDGKREIFSIFEVDCLLGFGRWTITIIRPLNPFADQSILYTRPWSSLTQEWWFGQW